MYLLHPVRDGGREEEGLAGLVGRYGAEDLLNLRTHQTRHIHLTTDNLIRRKTNIATFV